MRKISKFPFIFNNLPDLLSFENNIQVSLVQIFQVFTITAEHLKADYLLGGTNKKEHSSLIIERTFHSSVISILHVSVYRATFFRIITL